MAGGAGNGIPGGISYGDPLGPITLGSSGGADRDAGGVGGSCVLGMSLLYGRRVEEDDDSASPTDTLPPTPSDIEGDSPEGTAGR